MSMDMYQEYTNVLQEEVKYDGEEAYFSRSIDFEYCECGKLIKSCPDAYEHMSRGF
jgi:hypothetical protein